MGSNSKLQEWWSPPPDPDFLKRDEELSSHQATVTFNAKLEDPQFKNVQEDLRSFDIYYVERDGQTANVVHVTGYNEAVLKGQQVLDVFQRYDKQATRATQTG